MTTHRLIAKDGSLYFPHGGYLPEDNWTEPARREQPKMLLHVYPEGDCDRAPWPFTSDDDRRLAAAALYDERECNEFFETPSTIELPDGTPFDFDFWVS